MKEKCGRCGNTIDLREYGDIEEFKDSVKLIACKKCGCPHAKYFIPYSHIVNMEKYINLDKKEDDFGNKIII